MEQVKQYTETKLAQPTKPPVVNPKHISLLGTIALFFAMINYLPFTQPINQGITLLVCAALLWLTEAVHLSITALMIPVASVFLGIFESKDALAGFSHPIIYLFFGGFVLAAAIHSQGIDKLIAQNLLTLSKGRLHIACFMLFGVTAFLSMWISNTATTTIMIPLALGLLSQLDRQKYLKTYVFVLLGVGYSANIGGIGTMLGSPPNAIAAAQANISFKEWLSFGIPTVLLMMPTMLCALYVLFKPELFFVCHVKKSQEPLTLKAKATIAIFILTAFCWIESKDLAALFGDVKYFDTIIALCSVLLLSSLGLVKWSEIQQTTEWSVLILFGGGITLSKVLSVTGTSAFLAHQLSYALGGAEIALFLFTLLCFVVLLTNFASNTASATLLVPIFASIGAAFGISEFITCALIGVAANCAFMLPVGTPPNAIVYGSGYIKQSEMIRAGLFINLAAIIILFGLAKLLWNI